jgi:predicted NUDIX family NTP pyrophosphohydrolase
MAKESAGILVFRRTAGELEFLLVHPGGPFWKNKDAGAWTIPKGEIQPGEDPFATARREFKEELGFDLEGDFVPLLPIKQKGGKLVRAWAIERDFDLNSIKSNTFTIEWPPRSGTMCEFPEIDRAAFFPWEVAKEKINSAQMALLEQVRERSKAA